MPKVQKKVYVNLNDIFDLTEPSIFEMRLNLAYGSNGKNFWDNFFCCDKVHPEDTIIYLFTEYQLWFFLVWWKNTLRKCNDEEKKVLLHEMQKFRNVIETSDGVIDRLRTCYIRHPFYKGEVMRVFFGRTPINKNCINFFEGRFYGEEPGTTTEEIRRKKLMDLLAMRPKIGKVCGTCPQKDDEKWLRYLSQKLHFDHKAIGYCCTENVDCPVKQLVPTV